MNYKSQLKGWAIDRVTAFHAITESPPLMSLVQLTDEADKLVEYAYLPDEDFADLVKSLGAVIKETKDPLANVEQLLLELNALHEDITRQLNMAATVAN